MIDYKRLAQEYNYRAGDESPFKTVGPSIASKGYMTRDEFLTIVRWKSARALPLANQNSEQTVQAISRRAIATSDDRSRIKILLELDGVDVRMASAVLTIVYPQSYGVIDVRAWRAISDLGLIDQDRRTRHKTYFGLNDYLLYLDMIRRVADQNGMSPRDVDKALWKYDQSHLQV